MITDIEMSFRHLRDVALRDLTGVNIIVGPNNAGKTSIFRCIQAMSSNPPKNKHDYLCLGTGILFSTQIQDRMRQSNRGRMLFLQQGEGPLDLAHWFRNDHQNNSRFFTGNHIKTDHRLVFNLKDGELETASVEDFLKGPTKWRTGPFPLEKHESHPFIDAATRQQRVWRENLYFLWHRRKSHYEEELGAFHGRLDEEAEHLAGRVDQLIPGRGGGTFRTQIDRFMNSVLPGIGEIGIKRMEAKSGGKTTIRIVFSGAQEDRTLDELGGGVEQTLALAVVLLGEKTEGAVFIEEPESHLHESAQRRLIEQIIKHRGARQVFIATHSPVFVNEFPDAHVYRVSRGLEGNSNVHACVDRSAQRDVLNELGVLPSSLTQTNCVLWVEGPTETRLVRHWLDLVAPELRVHQHYEFAETGGSNLVSIAADVPPVGAEDLRDIMRICRHNFMICDRDAGIDENPAKAAVQTIESLVGQDYWITYGYEIEWYIPPEIISAVWDADVSAHMITCTNADKPFYEMLSSSNIRGTKTAGDRKVSNAERVIVLKPSANTWFAGDMGADLRANIERVAAFIRRANQMVEPASSTCEACGQPSSAP